MMERIWVKKEDIMDILPLVLSPLQLTRSEKWRLTRFKNKMKSISGVNEDILGKADEMH